MELTSMIRYPQVPAGMLRGREEAQLIFGLQTECRRSFATDKKPNPSVRKQQKDLLVGLQGIAKHLSFIIQADQSKVFMHLVLDWAMRNIEAVRGACGLPNELMRLAKPEGPFGIGGLSRLPGESHGQQLDVIARADFVTSWADAGDAYRFGPAVLVVVSRRCACSADRVHPAPECSCDDAHLLTCMTAIRNQQISQWGKNGERILRTRAGSSPGDFFTSPELTEDMTDEEERACREIQVCAKGVVYGIVADDEKWQVYVMRGGGMLLQHDPIDIIKDGATAYSALEEILNSIYRYTPHCARC